MQYVCVKYVLYEHASSERSLGHECMSGLSVRVDESRRLRLHIGLPVCGRSVLGRKFLRQLCCKYVLYEHTSRKRSLK